MPPEHLANLARVGQLKVEARNTTEVARMLKLAKTRLADAQLPHVSRDGRFASSYGAGHAAALVDIEESLVVELIALVQDLIADVENLNN